MKRVLTATCFAMAFAVGLAAQQQTTGTTGTTDDQSGQRRGGPRTMTGCLRTGDTAGSYMLTDIQMAGRTGTTGTTTPTTTTTGTTTTTTTTTGTTTTGGAAAESSGQRGQMPTSIMLNPADSSVDLKAHVGHKIEVTGTMAPGERRGGEPTATTAGGTTAGATSTSGTTMTGQSPQTAPGQRAGGTRTMNVTSVRMISESCS